MSVYTDQKEATRTEAIEETARVRLRHSSYRAIRNITCRLDDDGVLHLRGSVPTYHYKQLAQTAVVGIDGLQQIANEIEVESTS
jgi:osmotically-inducible protein OsmY